MTDRPNDRWLLPYLTRIRARPGAFLGGDERAETLCTLMTGYEQGRADAGAVGMDAEHSELLASFDAWLAKRVNYDLSSGSARWPQLIELLDDSRKNVLTFFKLFEEFLQSRGTSLDSVEPWTPRSGWDVRDRRMKRPSEDG